MKAFAVPILMLILTAAVIIFLSYQKINPFKPTRPVPSPSVSPTPISPSTSLRLPILLYHYVEVVKDLKDTTRQKLDIAPNVFDSQLSTLSENGYETVFVSDIGNYFDGKKNLPSKPIALTFDDGYKDFYTDVFPILKKHNAKATAYIIYNFLDKANYMTKGEVKEIAFSGLVEIASHTLSHTSLTGAKTEIIQKELVDSKNFLEELSGHKVFSFAYPYGHFNSQVETLVKDIGYLEAVTVVSGVNQLPKERFALKRLRPGSRSGKDLIQFLSTHQ